MSVREGKMNNMKWNERERERERDREREAVEEKVQLPNVQTINSIPLGMVNIYIKC